MFPIEVPALGLMKTTDCGIKEFALYDDIALTRPITDAKSYKIVEKKLEV